MLPETSTSDVVPATRKTKSDLVAWPSWTTTEPNSDFANPLASPESLYSPTANSRKRYSPSLFAVVLNCAFVSLLTRLTEALATAAPEASWSEPGTEPLICPATGNAESTASKATRVMADVKLFIGIPLTP